MENQYALAKNLVPVATTGAQTGFMPCPPALMQGMMMSQMAQFQGIYQVAYRQAAAKVAARELAQRASERLGREVVFATARRSS
jgi:hypothetical protein